MKPGKSTETEYHLLNAFELLWNVTDGQEDICDKIAEQSVDEMNLVEIMSHEPRSLSQKKEGQV